MSNMILKIARPGFDVREAENQDLVFGSQFNTFKIYRIMYFSGAGSAPHGLDYPPSFSFIKGGDTDWTVGDGFYPTWVAQVSVDDRMVYVTGKCYVILFVDPLNE